MRQGRPTGQGTRVRNPGPDLCLCSKAVFSQQHFLREIRSLWHPVNPSKITIMENDHAYVLDGGRVLGLSDATWDNEEIGRINLRERLSAHLQP